MLMINQTKHRIVAKNIDASVIASANAIAQRPPIMNSVVIEFHIISLSELD